MVGSFLLFTVKVPASGDCGRAWHEAIDFHGNNKRSAKATHADGKEDVADATHLRRGLSQSEIHFYID